MPIEKKDDKQWRHRIILSFPASELDLFAWAWVWMSDRNTGAPGFEADDEGLVPMVLPDLNMQIDFFLGAAPSVRQVETGAYTYKPIDTSTMAWSDLKSVTTVFHTDNGIQLGASSFDVKRAFSSYSYSDPVGL
jgi:hypothetical protein